jgi:Ca2+-binding RTX toxin-like protein
MARNPYWSSYYAGLATTLIANDGTAAVGFGASTSTYYEYEAYTVGYLSSSDTLDFVPVTMEAGSAYTIVSSGSYQTSISVFDSQGYLHLFVDGDDIGASDDYPYDSIIAFEPDSGGTYYVMVGYEYGSYTGSWQMLIARDVGDDGVNSLTATTTTTTTTTTNTVAGTDSGDALVGTSGADVMRGYGGDDTVTGGDGTDVIYGNQGVDILSGGGGEDTLYGGQNGGELTGDPAAYRTGTEWLYGNGGNDILYGNFGADVMDGGSGDDTLLGGQDSDTLSGGAGNDSINGNRGDDLMYGGTGSDLFGDASGNDTIGDFSYSEGDRIVQGSATSSIADSSGGALITFQSGNTITLVGVSASSVTTDYFT